MRRAARADPGEEPGGDLDRGQLLQQVTGASDWQVMRTGQQRGLGQRLGPIRTGEPGAATISTCSFRHGRFIPTSGGDRSAAWACLRNPLVFGDLQGRRLGDVDHLPPLQAGLGRVD